MVPPLPKTFPVLGIGYSKSISVGYCYVFLCDVIYTRSFYCFLYIVTCRCLYLVYSWVSGRHLGFITSNYFRKHWQYMDCMSNELSDLANIWIALSIRILTICSLQAYRQCTQAIVAAIFDLLLPVTSKNVSS